MSVFVWIVIGVAAGCLAKTIMPGARPCGISTDLTVGAVGALLAGWLIRGMGFGGATGLSLWTAVAAAMGAGALLYTGRAMVAPDRID